MKTRIKRLYLEGYTAKEIALAVNKSEGSVKMFIKRNLNEFKKLHKEQKELRACLDKQDQFNKIKELYLKGYNAKEIAKLLELSHGHIRNYISENLKGYGFEHRKARDLNKSIIKAINSTNNSYISNVSFLRQNRQSYKYDRNGNLAFDESTRGTRTIDVPKKFYKKNAI